MKLLCLQPPEARTLRANLPLPIESLRGANPPIGLLYVAAAARTVPGWEVELLDAAALGLSDADVAREVERRKPDLVGITATTFTLLDVLAAARAAKAAHPACRVIVGGVHPFLFPAETAALDGVDLVLSGEAEESFPLALRVWNEEGPQALRRGRVPGLLAKGDDPDGLAPAPTVGDLDAVPAPAWDLSAVDRYTSLVTRARPVTILLTSRGCPYRCRYCALSATGKRWRGHSPERVVEEMRTCAGLGVRYLLLYDEVFTVRKDRVHAICDFLRIGGPRVPWMARATTDTVDAATLAAMKGAGCDLVTFGIEAGSPKVLERLGRRAPLPEIVAAFDAARAAGLATIAYFMVGSPGETRADVDESLRVARRARPDMVHAAIFTPYPGSAFYEEGRAMGLLPGDYWREFAASPREGFRAPYWNELFTDAELEMLLRRFYRKFFLRPGYVLRRLARLRRPADLAAGWRGLWTLLRFRR